MFCRLRKQGECFFGNFNESIDISFCRVYPETDTGCGRNIESSVERAGAVFAGADTDGLFTEQMREVVRVDALESKGDKPAPSLRQ